MNQEKIGQIIKNIRKTNKLTQTDFANKYNVTYQAVSKWENGKNLPDVSVIRQICFDYNIDINELLDGEYKINKGNKLKILIPIIIILLIIFLILFVWKSNDNDFNFKTISSQCDNFTISGSISYNKKKSSIFISDIDYCGEEHDEKYQAIEASLYEKHNDEEKLISTSNYKNKELISLDSYLKDLVFTIDNYSSTCKEYTDNSLYIIIKATKKDGKLITYEIPLSLSGC